MRIAFIAAMLVAVISQPPAPAPPKVSQGPQQQTASERHESKTEIQISDQPVTITVNAPVPTQQTEKPNQTAAPQDSGTPISWPNRFIAFFTFVLAGVGFLQYLTLNRQANWMAEQSRLLGKSLVLQQRPKVECRMFVVPFVEHLHRQSFSLEDGNEFSLTWTGHFYAVNTGGTLATTTRGCSALAIYPPDEALPMDPSTQLSKPQEISIDLRPGMATKINLASIAATSDQAVRIMNNTLDIWIVGWLEYADAQGNLRRTGYCRKLRQNRPRRFKPVNDPDYEYAD